MMIRSFMATLTLTASVGLALPSYAQVTDQTDQSEEDWRKSRKKSGTSDIYRTPNTNSTGIGDVVPLTPVERLPSDSRRHLMRERAKAIAESEDGDISDAAYVPSEAAESDEALAREEQEAWDIIVTDMQGGGGNSQGEGGPNKVAVAGQGNGSASPGSRGGSTRTLQEIMDAIKNGQAGGGRGQTDNENGNANASASGQPSQDAAQSGAGQSSDAQSSDAQSQAGGQSDGDGSDPNTGEAQSTSDSQGNDDSQGNGEGQADAGSDGSASGDAGDGEANASDDAWPAATRAEEPLNPLERIRRSREDRSAEGTQRSASDYLGKTDDE